MPEKQIKQPQKRTDRRILQTEWNLHRACPFGISSNQEERVIIHKTANGFFEESRIMPIHHNGKVRSLTTEHQKIFNTIELLFREQGKPNNNRVYFTAAHFYDYLSNLSTLRTKKHKYFYGSRARDWLNDHFWVMAHVPIARTYWRSRNGSIHVPGDGKHLIKGYFIYQHGKKDDPKNDRNGLSWVELDSYIAESIRQGNIQPIFFEVANGIKNEVARILYPQLTSLLYKNLHFRENVDDVERAFAFNINGHNNFLKQLRKAGPHLIDLLIPHGKTRDAKIISYEVIREGRCFFLDIKAELVLKKLHIDTILPTLKVDPEMKKMLDREDEMLKRYAGFTQQQKKEIEPEINRIQEERYDRFRRNAAIADVVENLFFGKSRELILLTEKKNGFSDNIKSGDYKYNPSAEYDAIPALMEKLSEDLTKAFTLALKEKSSAEYDLGDSEETSDEKQKVENQEAYCLPGSTRGGNPTTDNI